ncbi:MAG: hypothetical protein MJ250_08735 [Alphaproteobacteria bacterium]|nr:hypothetical protein [Alphaproteobacteria bacterium]
MEKTEKKTIEETKDTEKNIELKDEELSEISAGEVKEMDWNIDTRSSKTHQIEGVKTQLILNADKILF